MRKNPPPKNNSLTRCTITSTKRSRKFTRTKGCTPINKSKRFLASLHGGPLDMKKILHNQWQNHTLVFTLKGETGYYDNQGNWRPV